jgi:glyoxylase-like metal-dependent hydrolase (beta-lactamase superfamily II)
MSGTEPALPDVSEAPPPIVGGAPAEVADGVFVLPDNRVPLVPNIGFVVGELAALVVDTGLGPRNGEYVLARAKRLAGDRPLYLTTTHFHPEHGFGAQAFTGAATIVVNRAQRDELARKGAGYAGMFGGFGPSIAAELADVAFVDPDVVYEGRLELDLGGHRVVLTEWGPAHSAGDQTILVDDRVLFTGDLAETRMFPITPYFPPHDTDFDGGRWIEVLGHLADPAPEIVVPGHGELADVTLLHEVRDYLTYVRAEVTRLRADGATVEQTVSALDESARAKWPEWANPEWIALAATAFHAKA